MQHATSTSSSSRSSSISPIRAGISAVVPHIDTLYGEGKTSDGFDEAITDHEGLLRWIIQEENGHGDQRVSGAMVVPTDEGSAAEFVSASRIPPRPDRRQAGRDGEIETK